MRAELERDEMAAYWFLRLQEPAVTVEEIDAALAWMAASEQNRLAFERVEDCWHVRATAAAPQASPVPAAPPVRTLAQRLGRVAALALLVVATAVGLGAGSAWMPEPTPARYTTAVGETRDIVLPDGSRVALGGASGIAVEYRPRERRVVLIDGEALFKVAKQPQRPFIVEAAGGSARALGTVFNVRRGAEGVTVSVAEGLVQVQLAASAAAPAVAGVRLPIGSEVTYSAAAGLGAVRAVNPERVLGWTRGVLTFIDRPLAAVVVDLNRYSPRLITIDDERIRHIRVTGSVTVRGIEEWLHALENVIAVELQETGTGLTLRAAPIRRAANGAKAAT